MQNLTNQPQLKGHLTSLFAHAQATGFGLSSQDVSHLMFDTGEHTKSACCRDEVYYIDDAAFCCTCGNLTDQY